jgi:hypothetical protein
MRRLSARFLMRRNPFFHCSLIIVLLFIASRPAQGQISPGNQVAPVPDSSQAQNPGPKLAPEAEEVAREIGVLQLIERFYSLPEHDRGVGGGPISMEALTLKTEIIESALDTFLEIDGVNAEIDSEITQTNELRAYLESRRDHTLNINNITNFITGGGFGIIGSALSFKEKTDKASKLVGIVAGGVSILISTIGLRQQNGEKVALIASPNMLAGFFERSSEIHSYYPEEIWTYLNAVPPNEAGVESRKAMLIRQWIELGRIDSPNTTKGRHKIELLTSNITEQHSLTIDLLADRAAMLADVRARISLMKRDLSKLMHSIKSHNH